MKKIFGLGFFLLFLTWPLLGSAEVTVFSERDCLLTSGFHMMIGVDVPDLSEIAFQATGSNRRGKPSFGRRVVIDDRIVSVEITEGEKVTLSEHKNYKGESEILAGGKGSICFNLRKLKGKVSSLKIVQPSRP
jgi:hypothetical protein